MPDAIICRTRGIPMTRQDEDGSTSFALDPAQHDPFEVCARLMRAAGAPEEDSPESIARFEAVMTARDNGCPLTPCPHPATCKSFRQCRADRKPPRR